MCRLSTAASGTGWLTGGVANLTLAGGLGRISGLVLGWEDWGPGGGWVLGSQGHWSWFPAPQAAPSLSAHPPLQLLLTLYLLYSSVFPSSLSLHFMLKCPP